MQPHDHRDAVRQLADDLAWLESHCRRERDLAAQAGQLRFAAALTRNVIGPALDGQPPSPLHVAAVGGAGAGKSTAVNLLAGTAVADANPQAGYTRHPTAYTPAAAAAWPETLGFLGPLRKLAGVHPPNLDEDVYQVRPRPAAGPSDPLAEVVVWDCPDMTTWAAEGYVSRLIEVAALADVVVYVASDERYNDEVPTQFLHLLVRAGKAVVVCLTKMREADAAALADHFRTEVLARVSAGADIPPVPVVPVPQLTPAERADLSVAAAKYRIPLVNQILALCPSPAAARARTVRNAVRFLEAAGEGLLDVARKDLAEIDAWKAEVAAGKAVFEDRYRKEYLAGEPFRRFDRTREQVLTMLELPAGARYVSAVLSILRTPYTFVRDQVLKLVTRPPAPSLPEADVLAAAARGWVEGLQAEALRRTGRPVWKGIARAFDGDLKADADAWFRQSARQFELKESDELEQAARSVPEWLVNRPGALTALRVGTLLADVAVVIVILVATWVPSWYHLLLLPLALGLTHQAAELGVRSVVGAVRHQARVKRESLLAEQLSGPFAAYLAEAPLAGDAPVERLRQVLARVPELIRAVAAAAPPPPPRELRPMTAEAPPFLRTLAPLLRGLDRRLRAWLDAPSAYPVPAVRRAEVEGVADDLRRKAEALDVDRPLLVVLLMGGTGVGKSTLLNALAGGPIAQASFTRPTTRDPVVYYHSSVPADRLDPALRHCKLARHDREELAQKVIVDTPDLDSNDLENREKLAALLPVADVVLYVGSQEKYHDRLGWELFKAQRRRRAFAFVLNKWDRCVQTGPTGLRPDDDLLQDLAAEGFQSPRLFRTTAQVWLDAASSGKPPSELVPGEQFAELTAWLERGLTRLEIEAVKARGVGQLLAHAAAAVAAVRPPDLSAAAGQVKAAWDAPLDEEAGVVTEVLVGALDPYQHEVEHHFSVTGQQRFRGLFAAYLRLTTKLRYAGSSLRDRIPLSPRLGSKTSTPADLDLLALAHDCARTAGERVLDQRSTALANRLLVEADRHGFPLVLLNDRTESVARLDWHDRLTRVVVDALGEVEREATAPTGWRRVVRGLIGLLANYLPEAILIGTVVLLLWRFFVDDFMPQFFHVLLPVYVTLGVLVVLHVLVTLTFPVRWAAIRGEFRQRLGGKVRDELGRAYLPVPGEVADELLRGRKQVDELTAEIQQVADWLRERESAAHVGELYGSEAAKAGAEQ